MFHYVKLVFHIVLFLGALVLYIINRLNGYRKIFDMFDFTQIVLACMWVILLCEMIFRFFPSSLESMGCQKVFKRNFEPCGDVEKKTPKISSAKSTIAVLVSWLLLNAVFGTLYYMNIFDEGILILISLAYSVCDMICILFFCPFQTWFMKNKCCNTCRIYNWDYAMIVTPLMFIQNIFAWSLVSVAFILLIVWEVRVRFKPQWFAPNTNKNLQCANCQEKLCHHKKQLQGFLTKCKAFYDEKVSIIQSKLSQDSKEEISVEEFEKGVLNQPETEAVNETTDESGEVEFIEEKQVDEPVKIKVIEKTGKIDFEE